MKKIVFTLLIIFPIICLGQIINVPGNYATIQEGIDAANDFDTVLVAPGTYAEHLEWQNKTIVLASHFLTTGDSSHIENTIIDGEETGKVIRIVEAMPGSHLCGFTIEGGVVTNDWGGGLDITGSDMLITDLIITNCSAERGGGMSLIHSPTALINLQVQNNEATDRAAGIWMQNSSTYMADCNISENTAPLGAGMYAYINTMEALEYYYILEACNFYENVANEGQTAGLWVRNEDGINMVNVALNACGFTDNHAAANTALQIRGTNVEFNLMNCNIMYNEAENFTAGASFTGGCMGEVVNTLFCGNTGNMGGGNWNSGAATVWGMETEVEFVNCTFAENSAAYGDALCLGPGAAAYMLNNILWDNGNQPIALLSADTTGASAYMDYNDLQFGMDSIRVDPEAELYWGDHNVTGDPLFEGSGDDPWAISSGSGCVDTGTPDTTGMGLPPFDIIGNVRVWDGGSGTERIDIGAYEYGADVWVGLEEPKDILSSSDREILIYPNPARDQIHILCEESIAEIRIYDQQGRLLIREDRSKTLDVSMLNSGFYFVEVLFENGRECRKLIIN